MRQVLILMLLSVLFLTQCTSTPETVENTPVQTETEVVEEVADTTSDEAEEETASDENAADDTEAETTGEDTETDEEETTDADTTSDGDDAADTAETDSTDAEAASDEETDATETEEAEDEAASDEEEATEESSETTDAEAQAEATEEDMAEAEATEEMDQDDAEDATFTEVEAEATQADMAEEADTAEAEADSMVGSMIATPDEICSGATPATDPDNRSYDEAEDVLESGVDYRAIFCTSEGAIYIELFEGVAPETVNNFVFLAENDYYNNTIFHRVIENFMAQGGDPTGTGSGGPGYQFQDETLSYLTFDRPGLLAMANAGPGTNGSQFFITFAPTPHLNGAHTIFGEVLEGSEIVDEIMLRDPSAADSPATDLQTVVIVTDPDMVNTTYEAPEAQTFDAQFFVDGFDGLNDPQVLPPDAAISVVDAEIIETSAVAETAPVAVPEDLQAAYTDMLESNNHDFRVTVGLESDTECREDFFQEVDYSVDSFASADDVQAVMDSGFLGDLSLAQGYESFEIEGFQQPLYMLEEEACEGINFVARFYLQRGSYLVTIDGILYLPTELLEAGAFPDDDPAPAIARVLQSNTAQIFDAFIGEAFRASVR